MSFEKFNLESDSALQIKDGIKNTCDFFDNKSITIEQFYVTMAGIRNTIQDLKKDGDDLAYELDMFLTNEIVKTILNEMRKIYKENKDGVGFNENVNMLKDYINRFVVGRDPASEKLLEEFKKRFPYHSN